MCSLYSNALPRSQARRLRQSLSRLAAAVVFAALAGALPQPGSAAETAAAGTAATSRAPVVVKIDNFTFAPAALTVPVGTTVTWLNDDDIPHTVADKDRHFRSKPLDTEDSFTYTFSTPGSFEYFCSLHPHMTGRIVVQPAEPGS
jgi:plastocyanin